MPASANRSRLRLSVMTACLPVLAACSGEQAALRQARDAIAATLPAPYFEDLVTESASIEGNSLVLRVRSPEGSAATIRGHARFDELRESEQRQMQELCALPALRPLFDGDAILVRRFLDREGEVIFETTLPAHACARIATREPTP
jgi:hypothetical protein